jgi:UDP-2,4-diacetamido-2,4,6-trideoxy-beta-L-altropyranose hydrolase
MIVSACQQGNSAKSACFRRQIPRHPASMNIAFRVDASARIGTGHFMRCLTLANALKQRGAQIRFVSRQLPEYLTGLLLERGHHFALLDAVGRQETDRDLPHAHWLGTSQMQDAEDTIKALSDRTWDWLVVDHYALDDRWETMLRRHAKQIAVIDDIADRVHDCDLLLDQNLQRGDDPRYLGKVPAHCRMLVGPRYTLLRDEFRIVRERTKPRHGAVSRLLIFFGGVDDDNYTGQAIAAIVALGIPDLHVDVVVGAHHPNKDQIASDCLGHGFSCHVQTPRMAELIAAADLAIGAGGTVTWERCCLGLPALVICVAENQREQIAAAACEGLLYAPDTGREIASIIQRHVLTLIENRALRQLISRAGMEAVDGGGVWRVVDNMVHEDIEMRVASMDDARNLFEWRNDPLVRAASRSKDLIDWETHEGWLTSVLNSSNRILLIGELAGAAVGVVRFDVRGEEAEISIYLVTGRHPARQGGSLLRSAERWLTANRPSIRLIRAEVLSGNTRSERLFLGAGYHTYCTRYTKRLGGP